MRWVKCNTALLFLCLAAYAMASPKLMLDQQVGRPWCVSQDGRYAVFGDDALYLMDLKLGVTLKRYENLLFNQLKKDQVALSVDNKYLYVISSDEKYGIGASNKTVPELIIVDLENGTRQTVCLEMMELKGFGDLWLRPSPDKRLVAIGWRKLLEDEKAFVIDSENGRVVRKWPPLEGFQSRYARSGNYLIMSAKDSYKVFDLFSGEQLTQGTLSGMYFHGEVNDVGYGILVDSMKHKTHVYDFLRGKIIYSREYKVVKSVYPAENLKLSPAGNWLEITKHNLPGVEIISLRHTPGHTVYKSADASWISPLIYSGDEVYLAILNQVDPETGSHGPSQPQQINLLTGDVSAIPSDIFYSIPFGSTKRMISGASIYDFEKNCLNEHKPGKTFGYRGKPWQLKPIPGSAGQFFAYNHLTQNGKKMLQYSILSQKGMFITATSCDAVDFSAHREVYEPLLLTGEKLFIGSGTGTIYCRDLSSGKYVEFLRLPLEDGQHVLWSTSGQTNGYIAAVVAMEAEQKGHWKRLGVYSASLRDASSAKLIAMSRSVDGKIHAGRFAVLSWEYGKGKYKFEIWDLERGKRISSSKNVITASQDGSFLIETDYDKSKTKIFTINDGELFSFDSISWKPIADIADMNYLPVQQTFFSEVPGEMWIYNRESGNKIQQVEDSYFCQGVTLSKDGKTLRGISGGALCWWDFETGKKLASTYFTGEEDYVTITPDGRFDGTPGGMKSLYYVDGLDVIPLESYFEKFYTPQLLAQALGGSLGPVPADLPAVADLKLPPKVKILSPAADSTVDSQQVTVRVDAEDRGGGVDQVRLYVNGKLVDETSRGMTVVQKDSVREFTISLSPGENRIKATAFNKDRTEAVPHEISVTCQTQPASAPDLYVIAVGLNEYKNPRYTLNFGKGDADAFAEALKAHGATVYNQIHIHALHDADATRTNVLSLFETVKQSAKVQDVFVFFYAGHGVMAEATQGNAFGDFHLALYGVTHLYGDPDSLKNEGFSAQELQGLLKEIPARKQLVVLDACQAGAAVNQFAMRGVAEEKALIQLARSAGIAMIAASGSNQYASEVEELKHGLFTYALLEGIRGKADGAPVDQKVTVKELCAYVENAVPELSTKHHGSPQYPNSWFAGNDFPIGVTE